MNAEFADTRQLQRDLSAMLADDAQRAIDGGALNRETLRTMRQLRNHYDKLADNGKDARGKMR